MQKQEPNAGNFIKAQKKLLISGTGKKLFYIAKIIKFIAIIAPFIKYIINWAKDRIIFIELMVSIIIEALSVLLCELTSWIVGLIPYLGLILGFMASFLIGKMFSSYFNQRKISRISNTRGRFYCVDKRSGL